MEQEGTDFNYSDEDRIEARIEKSQRIRVDEAVAKFSGLYESRSHFIRCAISRELRRLEIAKKEGR